MEVTDQKKILIVEDHQDMMKILKKYLKSQNYTAIEAENGELGLQKFKDEDPDLVLMDIMLPGMSGLDVIKEIKKIDQGSNYTPIIIITAKNTVSDIVQGLDAGADDYLVKPFHLDELIARVNSALRLKKLNELLLSQSLQLASANRQINNLNQTLIEKNRELRKNIFGLHTLFEISMELNSILEMKRLINSTLLTIIGQFSCKSALFLYALKPATRRLEVINSKGFFQKDVEDLVIQKSDPLEKFFETRGYPVMLKEMSHKLKNSSALKTMLNLHIEIITPIIVKNSLEGLICLGPRVKKQNYEERELQQISILSNMISVAVTNAALYNEVEQLSYTDGMTDLHNFRYFELRLKEEVVRHNRTKTGLSLLILDVDFFKNYNDTLGHQAGDEVLRKLGHILKETVRENDIVARYGGEEFAVILPAVDRDGASVLAERLRERIESAAFEHEEVQPNGNITVSIGVASLMEDSVDYKSLINQSDTALYYAKRNGRNQIKEFNEKMVM
ncbi:MAG: diguanylate cyclase [Calditrichaceae bacterium]